MVNNNVSGNLMVHTARRLEFEVIHNQVCRSRTSRQSEVK
jgi:hypothetical protein